MIDLESGALQAVPDGFGSQLAGTGDGRLVWNGEIYTFGLDLGADAGNIYEIDLFRPSDGSLTTLATVTVTGHRRRSERGNVPAEPLTCRGFMRLRATRPSMYLDTVATDHRVRVFSP
jgi:hypothetical protein